MILGVLNPEKIWHQPLKEFWEYFSDIVMLENITELQ